VLNGCLPSGRSETTVCRRVPCSASAPLSSSRASPMLSQPGLALRLQLIGCASYLSSTKPPSGILPAADVYSLLPSFQPTLTPLFRSVTSNHSYVLHQFLPPPVSYAYNLRPDLTPSSFPRHLYFFLLVYFMFCCCSGAFDSSLSIKTLALELTE